MFKSSLDSIPKKNNVEKKLVEKLREAGLPQDLTSIIDRKYKFVTTEGSVVAGKIIDLYFDGSQLLLNIYCAQIEMLSDGKGILRAENGGRQTWEGVLHML